MPAVAPHPETHPVTDELPAPSEYDPDIYRTGHTLGPEPIPGELPVFGAQPHLPPELADPILDDAPPPPDDVAFDDVSTETGGRVISERFGMPVEDPRVRELESRNTELEARIHSLESERQTLRKEIEEARERFTQSATFSKEREFLGLREIINRKEKDILDLRDALDAKDRQILDHKDKIRELDRARRDLEESTIGFERNLVAANEKVAELGQDREKSAEREKQLKARLDDAHVELRKAHDEIDALKKRLVQEEQRARAEAERLRARHGVAAGRPGRGPPRRGGAPDRRAHRGDGQRRGGATVRAGAHRGRPPGRDRWRCSGGWPTSRPRPPSGWRRR